MDEPKADGGTATEVAQLGNGKRNVGAKDVALWWGDGTKVVRCVHCIKDETKIKILGVLAGAGGCRNLDPTYAFTRVFFVREVHTKRLPTECQEAHIRSELQRKIDTPAFARFCTQNHSKRPHCGIRHPMKR